jgi:hypothetical protein
MYVAPRADVLFGDVFEASYLYDVHLQGDAARLTQGQFPKAAPLSGNFYTEPSDKLPLNGDVVRAHGRSGREVQGREHRDSHDLPGRAVLLSDDCHIPTAYGHRPDRTQARGRLLFAIVIPADGDEIREVARSANFGRFALPAAELLVEGGIAELRRTFLVRARDVHPDHRIVSLDEKARSRLERRWNAHVCRRGPEASLQNARKVGRLLAGDSEPTPEQVAAVERLWHTLDLAWDFEGRTMRAASEALEAGLSADAPLSQIVADLEGLSVLASEAARLLAEEHARLRAA